MDITEIILNDHHEQRRMFSILEEIDRADAERLTPVWQRLRILLEVHAKAEEVLFYPRLLEIGRGEGGQDSPGEETEDAIHDHNEIRDAIRDVDAHDAGTDGWWASLAKLNEVNSDHMAEEEREGLTDFRRHASLQLRHDIGLDFAVFEAAHALGVPLESEDPKRYVHDRS